jgi:hypothetical protein
MRTSHWLRLTVHDVNSDAASGGVRRRACSLGLSELNNLLGTYNSPAGAGRPGQLTAGPPAGEHSDALVPRDRQRSVGSRA